MKRRAPITSIMTDEVTAIDRTVPLSEVYKLLRQAPFHHVPVVENDKPVGIISSIDVLRLVYDVDGQADKAVGAMLDYQFNVDDAMTPGPRTLPDSATIRDAADVLADGDLHSVLITNGSGMLVGIVTSTDLIRYLRDL